MIVPPTISKVPRVCSKGVNAVTNRLSPSASMSFAASPEDGNDNGVLTSVPRLSSIATGQSFTGLYFLCFHSELRSNIPSFTSGGWLIYLIYLILISMLIAASAIDLELWIIPVSMCWLVSVLALIGCAIAGYLIDPKLIRGYRLLPFASADTGALAAGAAAGLGISMLLLVTGLLQRSYEYEDENQQ